MPAQITGEHSTIKLTNIFNHFIYIQNNESKENLVWNIYRYKKITSEKSFLGFYNKIRGNSLAYVKENGKRKLLSNLNPIYNLEVRKACITEPNILITEKKKIKTLFCLVKLLTLVLYVWFVWFVYIESNMYNIFYFLFSVCNRHRTNCYNLTVT